MKKILTILLLSLPLTIFSSTLVILECELIDDGTIEDVKRINSAWVKSVNEPVSYTHLTLPTKA